MKFWYESVIAIQNRLNIGSTFGKGGLEPVYTMADKIVWVIRISHTFEGFIYDWAISDSVQG